jgi:hypothetical protein
MIVGEWEAVKVVHGKVAVVSRPTELVEVIIYWCFGGERRDWGGGGFRWSLGHGVYFRLGIVDCAMPPPVR